MQKEKKTGEFQNTKNKETVKTNVVPLGIRNNNPLNIVHSPKNNWHGMLMGQKGRFCAFTHARWGFRAAAIILRKYINVYLACTIKQIVTKWAPATENNTEAYIKFVETVTGIDRNQQIQFNDTITMLLIMSAMCQMENGIQYNPQKNSDLWEALYQGYFMARENTTDFANLYDPMQL